ncbi:MAG: hypothetical protein H6563_07470 [Lewinellaceae bacterium]|nr:hypothetical protein [Lewinellaceae bacterium]
MKWEIDGATTVNDVSTKTHRSISATVFAVTRTSANQAQHPALDQGFLTNTAERVVLRLTVHQIRDHQTLCIDLSFKQYLNNNIGYYNCNGTNAQKWIYDRMTRSIRSVVNQISACRSGSTFDRVYGKRSNVNIYDCNGSAAQQF